LKKKLIDLSIITVTYNHQHEIVKNLQALLRALSLYQAHFIIIDNASTDSTVSRIQSMQSALAAQHLFTLIKNKTNVGFTKAVNQGLAQCCSQYILILNPDTQLFPATLPPLIKFLELHQACGIVSPQFLNLDGSIQASCRRFPRHRDLLFLAVGLDKLFSQSKIFNHWKMGDFDFRSLQKVDQPQGAFLLTHRTAVKQVGMWDEKFPMFFSDVDWCRRFIAKGWEIFFLPDVQIVHDKGTSIHRNRLQMIWSSHRSFYDYFKKYYPGKIWQFINLLTAGLLILMAILRSLFLVLTTSYWEIK